MDAFKDYNPPVKLTKTKLASLKKQLLSCGFTNKNNSIHCHACGLVLPLDLLLSDSNFEFHSSSSPDCWFIQLLHSLKTKEFNPEALFRSYTPSFPFDAAFYSRAGFYYDPAPDTLDQVTCPSCQLSLQDWDAQDDPLNEHVSRRPRCFYAKEALASSQKLQKPTIDAQVFKLLSANPFLHSLQDLTPQESNMTVSEFLLMKQQQAKSLLEKHCHEYLEQFEKTAMLIQEQLQ